ncbi:MAG: universal stress protein [Gammaproteobacteria bacterium]|nr:universal stress protein [Gammaproteobacteria bacterium]
MAEPNPSLQVRKIFVVIDPQRLVQAALEKGEWLARRNGAELELYCSVDPESAADAEAQARLIERTQSSIERLVEKSKQDGLKISIRVEANSDWRAAIAKAASASGADLVIKTASPRGPLRRRLMQTGDWTLLRNCSRPILLASPTRSELPKTVLAAVKVNPDSAVYDELNRRVVDLSHRIAELLEAELHAVTVYRGEGVFFDRQKLADQCRLPRNRVHSVEGSPYEGIAQVAEQIGAGAVVVGSAPRPTGGSVLGTTAERVIDEVPGDIVVLPAT